MCNARLTIKSEYLNFCCASSQTRLSIYVLVTKATVRAVRDNLWSGLGVHSSISYYGLGIRGDRIKFVTEA